MTRITSHHELDVYKRAFAAAMQLFSLSKSFPKGETYSLIDQMRRSSRSVCANLAEAWRKRRYLNSFISKLNDAETEAGETQVWIEFAVECGYLDRKIAADLYRRYNKIIATIVGMITHPENGSCPNTSIDSPRHPFHPFTPSPFHPLTLSLPTPPAG